MKKIVKEAISIIIILIVLFPAIIFAAPFIVGGTKAAVVTGGSMEPTIHIGSVAIIKKVDVENIKVGDIIAFKTGKGQSLHRVIEILSSGGKPCFRTKGDANEDPDPWIVYPEDVYGVLYFTIPYYGYLIWFAGTPLGAIIFLLIPAALIIANEILKILKAAKAKNAEKNGARG